MNELILNIAGYILRFNWNINNNIYNNINYNINARFSRFIIHEIPEGRKADLEIVVHPGKYELKEPHEIFRASLPEGTEIAGGKSLPEFWSIIREGGRTYLRAAYPGKNATALLRFSLDPAHWDLWPGNDEGSIDPLEYPLDGLILYYLSVARNDIMIHASGVNLAGKGIIFSGISGMGKSTIASILREHGAEIINDDRLILRKNGDRYIMYNTPVYPDEEPKESFVDKIFLIGHGRENSVKKLWGAEAMSRLMANCMQHNWDHEIISRLLASVNDLCSNVPVYRLDFIPDKNVINYLLKDE